MNSLNIMSAYDRRLVGKLVLEVYCPTLIRIKYLEHIVCERARVAEREELSVYALELLLGECPARTVLQETYTLSDEATCQDMAVARTFVPLLQLFAIKMCRPLELVQLLRR